MSRRKPTIWGDIVFVLIIVCMFVIVVYGLHFLVKLPPLQLADQVILGGALLSLGISAMFNIYASDGHAYDRFGFELCGVTLGTCLSLLTAQLLSGKEALPRLGHMVSGWKLDHSEQVAVVSLLGFVSVFGLALTAHIVRSLAGESHPACPNLLSFISFVVGFLILFGYVSVLLGAGA
jgi:hypothetical protein